jgi:hypothetical protein
MYVVSGSFSSYMILLPTPSKYEEIPKFYYLAAIYLHNILDFSC